MKYCFAAIFVVCVTSMSYGQFVIEKSPIVITVNKEKLIHCNNIASWCENIPIKRIKEQTTLLLLPLNGTSTSAILYKEDDFKKYKNDLSGLDKRSDEKMLGQGQPLTLNLTYLADGNYIVIYHSEGFSATIRLSLQQNK